MPVTKAEEEPTTRNLHSEDRYYDQVQVYLPAKQDPTYRVKVKITQQNNRGGKRDNKTKIVDTKMRNKKTVGGISVGFYGADVRPVYWMSQWRRMTQGGCSSQ